MAQHTRSTRQRTTDSYDADMVEDGPVSMNSSFDMYRIDHAKYVETLQFRDEGENRVTIPKKLEKNGTIYIEDTLNWFIDTIQDLPFIAGNPEPWQSTDRFDKEDSSRIDDQRVTNAPKQFFKDYVGPHGSSVQGNLNAVDEEHRLRYDHLYFLLAPEICFVETSGAESYGVYLVPVEEYVELYGKELAEFRAGESVTPYLEGVATNTDSSDDPDPPAISAEDTGDAIEESNAEDATDTPSPRGGVSSPGEPA